MAKINLLKARQVMTLANGFHSDGACLFLRVTGISARQWVFRYKRHGKVRQIGLGSVHERELAAARDVAAKMRQVLADGGDPASVLNRSDPNTKTFRQYGAELVEAKRSQFRSEKHAKQWPSTLKQYAYPVIGEKRPSAIGLDDVEAILRPIWDRKTETADRVRSRIETVLDYAFVAEGIEKRNPAVYKGNLEHRGFAPRRKVTPIVHHPAAPFIDVPSIMSELRENDSTRSMCLRFIILTWARSGEARGAAWSEIDTEARLWTVPAKRMKAGRLHVVPLSDEALEVLTEMKARRRTDTDRVFPGRQGGLLCDTGINKVLHGLPTIIRLDAVARASSAAVARVKDRSSPRPGATVHGMRAAARSWAAATTSFDRTVLEAALAHTNRDKTEAAYQRDNVLEKRRKLMVAWGSYCRRSNVVPFSRKAVS